MCVCACVCVRVRARVYLSMNFRSFHFGPREFFTEAHWSLPPLEASLNTVRAP
jgi:hypothetical protein